MGEITGVGVDLVEIDRMERVLSERGRSRVFTDRELEYCEGKERPIVHLSGRFAGKEAVIKALGIGERFVLKDIEIVGNEGGPPEVILRNGLSGYNDKCRILLSISHTDKTAAAYAVVVEK